jgi:hypothetical protein
VPDVVDADVDHDDGGLLVEDVLLEAGLEVGHLVAADARVDGRDAEALEALVDAFLGEGDVALLAPAALGDSITQGGAVVACKAQPAVAATESASTVRNSDRVAARDMVRTSFWMARRGGPSGDAFRGAKEGG